MNITYRSESNIFKNTPVSSYKTYRNVQKVFQLVEKITRYKADNAEHQSATKKSSQALTL